MGIDFEFQTEFGVYRDSLNLPKGQEYTAEQIEEMKRQRVNNWLEIVRNPPQEAAE